MRLSPLALALSIATIGAAALGASDPDAVTQAKDAGAEGGAVPACVMVRAEARYIVAGYKHIVILTNGCSKAVVCSVATDVNPAAQTVEVASNATVEVVTFLESPSRVFTPNVSCKLR